MEVWGLKVLIDVILHVSIFCRVMDILKMILIVVRRIFCVSIVVRGIFAIVVLLTAVMWDIY